MHKSTEEVQTRSGACATVRGVIPVKRVLVVEDEAIFADNVRVYLERHDYCVRVANDGRSAISLAPAFEPDVLLLDYRLPDMTGLDVFDAVCSNRILPSILTTSLPSDDVYRGAAERNIRNLLLKPFPLAELAAMLRVLTGRAS
jgi:DNA-binding response OmpR family regulator